MKAKVKQSYNSSTEAELKKKAADISLQIAKRLLDKMTKPEKNSRIIRVLRDEMAFIQTKIRMMQLSKEENHDR